MLTPVFKLKTKYFYQEFIMVSIVSALSVVIAIRANERFDHDYKICKKEKKNTLRCRLINNENYKNIEVFFITFMSTFISYLLLYFFFGYGFK